MIILGGRGLDPNSGPTAYNVVVIMAVVLVAVVVMGACAALVLRLGAWLVGWS